MRFSHLAFLGALSLCAGAGVACGSGNIVSQSGTTTGAGGTGGGGTTTTGAGASDAGPGDAAPDVDFGMPSTTYPAVTGILPQVQNNGGAVLANPRFVPVFFSNEDPTVQANGLTVQAGLTDFLSRLGGNHGGADGGTDGGASTGSAYWTATTAEYGVGAATTTLPVVLTEAAPATIDDSVIQTWLAGKLNGNDKLWPAADANTVYVLHYPANVTVTAGGGSSCVAGGFGGYHDMITLDAAHGTMPVAYAVLPRCATSDGVTLGSAGSVTPIMFTGVDAVTASESHELIEAATDPYPQQGTAAWNGVDTPHRNWSRALSGGEVGDLCALPASSFTKFPEIPYAVQRTWSNAAALQFHDPCVPVLPGTVYFQTLPAMPDTITTTAGSIKGVIIPVGMSKTIDLDFVSDAATSGPWTVKAYDVNALYSAAGTAYLKLSLDRDTGVNGDKAHLTITVMSASTRKNESFLLGSKLNGVENFWVGLVGN